MQTLVSVKNPLRGGRVLPAGVGGGVDADRRTTCSSWLPGAVDGRSVLHGGCLGGGCLGGGCLGGGCLDRRHGHGRRARRRGDAGPPADSSST